MTIELGVGRLFREDALLKKLSGKRVAFAGHEASVNEELHASVDVVLANEKRGGYTVSCFFSPQHGFWGEEQDNMIETGHAKLKGRPLYSLYSETRKPKTDWLKDCDVVLADFQDIGARIYTYMNTVSYLMEVASELGKEVVILDRPNPIDGLVVQGTTLDTTYSSFVGLYPMPTRHGLTMGEIAQWMNERHQLNVKRKCKLTVIPMKGWKRNMFWGETGLTFVMPSPNIPFAESTWTFPGFVYFEGAMVSEARGTTRPLEQGGAPYVNPDEVMGFLDKEYPSWRAGCRARATGFIPTFQKFQGKLCKGIFIHPFDREQFNPVRTGISILRAMKALYPKDFQWKEPPYEYEYKRPPIDMIAGGPWIREWIEGRHPWKAFDDKERGDVSAFLSDRKPFLLY
jgi:uncharacterized protein YbbC (DUF1343 family)